MIHTWGYGQAYGTKCSAVKQAKWCSGPDREGLGVAKTEESATRRSLDRREWVEGAIDALADEGVAGMCVEALAKRLGVTKGSFYWHFKDRHDLVDAVLQTWQAGRIREVDRHVTAGSGRAQLLQLIDSYGDDCREIAIELAVRDWARRDAQAATAVEAVDRHRLESACRLFVATGLGEAEARSRSLLLLACLFGQSLLALDRRDPQIAACKRSIAKLIVPSSDGV